MSKLFFLLLFYLSAALASAQQSSLPILYINEHISTHLVMSEPIRYVDISTAHIIGDMPLDNILRIKPNYNSYPRTSEQGVLTIVCQRYMVQYELRYTPAEMATRRLLVSGLEGTGLLHPESGLSTSEMKSYCKQVINTRRKKTMASAKAQHICLEVRGIYVFGDYYFVDVAIANASNIPFSMDQVSFRLEDKSTLESTNSQDIDLIPEFQLNHQSHINERYRNVFVFKKFTFPNAKVLKMEVTEKRLSGRKLSLSIDYKKILEAEAF